MPKYEILNHAIHNDLTVASGHSAAYGDNVPNTLTFITEFASVSREYPIFFRKDSETGEFLAFAVFGLQDGENLFLTNDGWTTNYIPAALARGPFLIGFQDQSQQGGNAMEPVIHVDMEHPRINGEAGERFFTPEGELTDFAKQISHTLKLIHHGMEANKEMFAAFTELDLIEAFTIDIELNNGEKISLQGNYTIHEEKLANLDGESLEILNKKGFLQAAFLVLNSINNVKRIIELKNRHLG